MPELTGPSPLWNGQLRLTGGGGAPVYVRHEIVHNRFVVEGLRAKGAIFIDEVDDAPDGSVLIFSAHGVSKAVQKNASDRDLHVIDATLPTGYQGAYASASSL